MHKEMYHKLRRSFPPWENVSTTLANSVVTFISSLAGSRVGYALVYVHVLDVRKEAD